MSVRCRVVISLLGLKPNLFLTIETVFYNSVIDAACTDPFSGNCKRIFHLKREGESAG